MRIISPPSTTGHLVIASNESFKPPTSNRLLKLTNILSDDFSFCSFPSSFNLNLSNTVSKFLYSSCNSRTQGRGEVALFSLHSFTRRIEENPLCSARVSGGSIESDLQNVNLDLRGERWQLLLIIQFMSVVYSLCLPSFKSSNLKRKTK